MTVSGGAGGAALKRGLGWAPGPGGGGVGCEGPQEGDMELPHGGGMHHGEAQGGGFEGEGVGSGGTWQDPQGWSCPMAGSSPLWGGGSVPRSTQQDTPPPPQPGGNCPTQGTLSHPRPRPQGADPAHKLPPPQDPILFDLHSHAPSQSAPPHLYLAMSICIVTPTRKQEGPPHFTSPPLSLCIATPPKQQATLHLTVYLHSHATPAGHALPPLYPVMSICIAPPQTSIPPHLTSTPRLLFA